MFIRQRIDAFVKLGKILENLPKEKQQEWVTQAYNHNTWFSQSSVETALKGIVRLLKEKSLTQWLAAYPITEPEKPLKVGVIMAGNIPLVGFHDFMTVLLSGHPLYAKLSSQDAFLPKVIASLLTEVEPEFASMIHFVESLKDVDAVIATGSDNSARYFEYYFSKFPNIIRKNRTSVAVLSGKETEEDLKALGGDILTYFGLGCRNVSKLYLPEGFDLVPLLKVMEPLGIEAIDNHKYANNYDYNKSIYLVNKVEHLDNGYVLFTANEALVSPVGVVYYEYYQSEESLKEKLQENQAKIQCVVSREAWLPGSFSFGKAQFPEVSDYADGVDTMKFLIDLKK
ncbi:acyl-CoA reductase [Rapidithrix thailandica]|uniref:Acyl-CoA reductase n=1 Tax=Rapidithrix thailandica TaxID=413964 RepID=A0AAW9S8D5_9BACT